MQIHKERRRTGKAKFNGSRLPCLQKRNDDGETRKIRLILQLFKLCEMQDGDKSETDRQYLQIRKRRRIDLRSAYDGRNKNHTREMFRQNLPEPQPPQDSQSGVKTKLQNGI